VPRHRSMDTLTYLRGIRHVAEVAAEWCSSRQRSRCKAFRQSQFVGELGPAARLESEVRSATTEVSLKSIG